MLINTNSKCDLLLLHALQPSDEMTKHNNIPEVI